MTPHSTTDWTTPEAYGLGAAPVPRWRHVLTELGKLFRMARAESRLRREVRMLRELQYATRDMPAYLRRDIGLDN